MDDKKLLELAAKAAGVPIGDWAAEIRDYYGKWNGRGAFESEGGYWNPLTDDGDALRLAVKLHIWFELHVARPFVTAWAQGFVLREPVENDECSATRRAIVRAAAALAEV